MDANINRKISNHSTIKIDDERETGVDREGKKQTLSQFFFFNSSETYL